MTITVELFDGSVLEFPDGTADTVIDRVAKQETASRKNAAPAMDVVGTTADGGRVYRMANGKFGFTSPAYATTDPEQVRKIMDGMTPGDVSKASVQEGIVAENPVVSRAIKAVEGVPFVGPYVDEAAGAMFGSDAQAGVRAASSAMDATRPGQSAGLQLGGGILGSIPMAMAAAPSVLSSLPSSMAGKMLAGGIGGLIGGGIEGLVSGYGRGEGDTRPQSAYNGGILGAATGGAIGALMPPVAAGIGKAYGAAADFVKGRSRALPGMTPEATNQVLLRAQADNIGSDGVANMARLGNDAMLADAGPAMSGLADQSVSMSPAGATVAGKAVSDRTASLGGQLRDTFDSVMGGPQGRKALSDAITEETQPGIRDAYKQAYDTIINYAGDAGKKIEGIVSRIPKSLMAKATAAANDRMVWDGIPDQMLIKLGDDGTVTASKLPRVIHLDYIKRALDQIAEAGTDPITKRMSPDAAFAAQIAKTLRNAVKDAVPAYGDALNQASDAFALRKATDIGASLLSPSTTREAVKEWAADAGPMDLRAMAEGLRSNIDERMANVRRAVSNGTMAIEEARKIIGDMSSEAARSKIGAVFSAEEAKTITDALDKASAALELQAGIATNSKTAPRIVGDAALKDALEYSPTEIARSPLTAPRKAFEIFTGNTPMDKAGRSESVYREIAGLLTGPKGYDAVKKAQEIAGLLSWVPGANAASAAAGRLGAGSLGVLGYLLAGQNQR